ncbi:hypothetical protein VPH35_131392 [Triticum aestivum]
MKKKGVSIFEMWDKSSKTRKITSTSTPTSLSIEVESNLQLAIVQRHDEAPQPERETTPIVEDDEAFDEDDESMPQFEADLAALERDSGKRLPISSYHANDQDRVRRRYIDLGVFQPKDHKFEIRDFSGHPHRFCPTWFKDHKWLEYSVQEEAAFCFVCYLFKDKTKSPGGDAFMNGGFNNWNLKARLKRHIGAVSSAHAEAPEKYDKFTIPATSIRESIASNTTQYKVEMFVGVIDRQLHELNARFDEVNTELLTCMATFSPRDSFAAYDKEKLVSLARKFYAKDFTNDELSRLSWQLSMFISHVRKDKRFSKLKSLCELPVLMVETRKNEQYYIVYKLLKLVLTLPVATASVERVFSSMKYVKNSLRNKMGDEYLNNCLVTFVKREFFRQVKDEDVINLFQKGDRKVIL